MFSSAAGPVRSKLAPVLLALVVLGIIGGGLVVWSDPLAPVLLIGAAVGAAAVIVLLQQPLAACYFAVLLFLFPYGLRPPALDLLYTVAVNGALVLALGATLIDAGRGGDRLLFTWPCVALALFIGWAVVTLLWAPDIVEARMKLVAYASGLVLLFVISNQIRSARAVDGLMAVMAIIGWVMVGCGLFVLVTGGFQLGSRLKVFDMNQNEFGAVLIAMTPGVIWPVLRSKGLRRRIGMALSVVFLLCALVLIALTGSRGSSLSLLLVLLAFSFSRQLRPWSIVGMVLCAGMLLGAPFLLASVVSRIAEQDGGQFGGRDVIWTAGLRMFADEPWTGAGIGNGPIQFHAYLSSLTSEFNFRTNLPAHNPLLAVALDTGIVGMALYVNVCYRAVSRFLSPATRTNMRDYGLGGYFALLLGIGVGYFVSWIKAGGVESQPTFFLMIALLTIPSQFTPLHGPHLAENPNSCRRGRASGSEGSLPRMGPEHQFKGPTASQQ